MRKLFLLMHVSLDGYVAGPNGEMDWINVDNEIFEFADWLTDQADTALYGRVTFQMMEQYWPTAAEQPEATSHDIKHSDWVNKALKVVFSKTLKESGWDNTRFIGENIPNEIRKLKMEEGKNLLMIGSPHTAQYFMEEGLIDEYFINLNPIILGSGIPLFKKMDQKFNLKLLNSKTFPSGVISLHYETIR